MVIKVQEKQAEPETLDCATVGAASNQRMIFTAEGRLRTMVKPLPAILGRRWRAPDGRTASILCNYANTPQTVRGRFGSVSIPAVGFRRVEE